MMNNQQIQAAVLHGVAQTLRYEPFAAPVARDGEAVVTVTAAVLKPSDRRMAAGVHHAPATFPHVVGLDGVGRLSDGGRVAFFAPQRSRRENDRALARPPDGHRAGELDLAVLVVAAALGIAVSSALLPRLTR